MNRYCGQPWWSTACFKIWAGSFCLVELRGLEPLTPCLQTEGSTSTAVCLCRSASQGVRSGPPGSWPVAVLSCCTVQPLGLHARLAGALLVRASTYDTGPVSCTPAPPAQDPYPSGGRGLRYTRLGARLVSRPLSGGDCQGFQQATGVPGATKVSRVAPPAGSASRVPVIDANLLEVAFTCDHAVWFVGGSLPGRHQDGGPGNR